MKITLPDGTTIEGTREEVEKYLPPVPERNWDGSYKATCHERNWDGSYKATCPKRNWDGSHKVTC